MKIKKIVLSMKALCIFACVLSFSSCSQDDVVVPAPVSEESSDVNSGVSTKSIGSGIDLVPDNTWDGVSSSGSDNKVRIFKKGSSTYVIAVDLSTGAKVLPYYEFASGYSNATVSNPDPRFVKNTVSTFNLSSLQWYAVTNFGFFGDRTDQSGTYSYTNDHASFLLKKNGTVVSCGYGTYSAGEPQRSTLAIVGSAAAVVDGPGNISACVPPYNSEVNTGWKANVYNQVQTNYNSFSNILVGLHPVNASKTPNALTGRTFVGVRQKTPLTSGGPVYLYILVAASLQQQQAYTILQGFGCDESDIVMFDGSGSTQMKSVTSEVFLPSSDNREVPLWLAVKLN
jgi:hypothetical protein